MKKFIYVLVFLVSLFAVLWTQYNNDRYFRQGIHILDKNTGESRNMKFYE